MKCHQQNCDAAATLCYRWPAAARHSLSAELGERPRGAQVSQLVKVCVECWHPTHPEKGFADERSHERTCSKVGATRVAVVPIRLSLLPPRIHAKLASWGASIHLK